MAIEIRMPALSPTMTEGKLAKWIKHVGDSIESGEVIAEIETDKATMEVEAADDGILARILVEDGTEGVKVNDIIGIILEQGEDDSALDQTQTEPANSHQQDHKEEKETKADRILVSPVARRMAETRGLKLSDIKGSGPNGRIIKRDIGRLAEPPTPTASPTPTTLPTPEPDMQGPAFHDVANSTIRKVIAKRLTEAKRDIPHFYLGADCEVDALIALRKELNAESPDGEGAYKISLNDLIVRAVAMALKKVPGANVGWSQDAIRVYHDIDISLAVATPNGLITPVIHHANTLGLADLSRRIKELAARARQGKLTPEEYLGGTFTISNLGMYGVKDFSAIINPPQSCIIAVGSAEPRPVVRNGELAIATMMSVTLSVDHRAVDGAVGAEFLNTFKGLIEQPLTMML